MSMAELNDVVLEWQESKDHNAVEIVADNETVMVLPLTEILAQCGWDALMRAVVELAKQEGVDPEWSDAAIGEQAVSRTIN